MAETEIACNLLLPQLFNITLLIREKMLLKKYTYFSVHTEHTHGPWMNCVNVYLLYAIKHLVYIIEKKKITI